MLLTLPAVALQLGISRRTLEREIADGRVPVVMIRGAVRIDEIDLQAYIQQSRIKKTRPCPSENAATAGMSAFKSAASASSAALARLLQKRTPSTMRPDSART
jgi:excisionase family DNA binding protein